MPINLSTILAKATQTTIDAMRPELVAEAKRLEGYHDKIGGFIADNNRDEPPPECDRKPLRWKNGDAIYAVVRDSDNACLSAHNTSDDARHHAEAHTFTTSVVRVMEPEGNECPTERIAPEGCEWGIIKIADGTIFWCSHHHNFYSSANILNESARFPSKAAAADSIAECGMTDCQPWPIPPKGGAE